MIDGVDLDIGAIVLLLPIASLMTVFQKNPYHALVVRGILGAIAALVYALFGAADVALTEALVGTMLAITLYAVAVRSSLVLRFGVIGTLEKSPDGAAEGAGGTDPEEPSHFMVEGDDLTEYAPFLAELAPLIIDLRAFCSQHFLRLELFAYRDRDALEQALKNRDIHAIGLTSGAIPGCLADVDATGDRLRQSSERQSPDAKSPEIVVRVERLYELMQLELNPAIATLRHVPIVEGTDLAPNPTTDPRPQPASQSPSA